MFLSWATTVAMDTPSAGKRLLRLGVAKTDEIVDDEDEGVVDKLEEEEEEEEEEELLLLVNKLKFELEVDGEVDNPILDTISESEHVCCCCCC